MTPIGVLAVMGMWPTALPGQDDRTSPGERPGRARLQRDTLERPDFRVLDVAPPEDPADPRMDAILTEWSKRTRQIKKIQGKHRRLVRDMTFQVESWAEGKFYVETPEKGRIDILPYNFANSKAKPNTKVARQTAGGKPMLFTIKPGDPECWICDGKDIKQINAVAHTYDLIPIPPEQRGENIMDGPLPFLFGMPPEKAKNRYRFRLVSESEKAVRIEVYPKLKQDAIEWKRAEVFLDRTNYFLPQQVQLDDPANTKTTIYVFTDLEVNKINLAFWTNPFSPLWLARYKREVRSVPDSNPNGVPSVVGMSRQSAGTILQKCNCEVRFLEGEPADVPEQELHVAKQNPPANTPLKPGLTVFLTYYGRSRTPRTAQENDIRKTRKPPVLQDVPDESNAPQTRRTAKLPEE